MKLKLNIQLIITVAVDGRILYRENTQKTPIFLGNF
jgi:hypothetical protein